MNKITNHSSLRTRVLGGNQVERATDKRVRYIQNMCGERRERENYERIRVRISRYLKNIECHIYVIVLKKKIAMVISTLP